jgi:hypothetical protein
MTALDYYRLRLSQITLVCSVAVAIVLLAELSLIPVWSHISRAWLHAHPWLWRHSDDKSLLRLFIDSWAVAIGLLFISLVGLGKCKQKSFAVSVSSVIGFPALFFGLLALDRLSK